jgi:hypothetical protein
MGDVAKGAQLKLAQSIVKGCTKTSTDCPSCYSGGDCSVTGHTAATVANLASQLDAFTPLVTCEQTSDKAKAKCIDSTAKSLAKLVASQSKCYDKCYKAAQKGTISAVVCLPPASDDDAEACIAKASAKAASSIDKACFIAPAAAPSCYDGTTNPDSGADWADLVEAAVDRMVPATYCGP